MDVANYHGDIHGEVASGKLRFGLEMSQPKEPDDDACKPRVFD